MNPMELSLIDAREKGQIAISIATSLALEGAFGVYPDRPESPPPIRLGVQQIWVNLRTLVRNFYGSLSNDAKAQITPPAAAIALQEEMSIIESTVLKYSEGTVSVLFYYCDYDNVPRKFPKANLKGINTDKQRIQHTLEVQTLRELLLLEPRQDVRHFKLDITGSYPHVWMITHYPVDLLNRYRFRKLELLESHTGIVKPYQKWYTKFTGGKDLDFIPFNKFTLQVFGDGGALFSPISPKLKSMVVEMAQKDNWNATTTDEKIRHSIQKLPHPADRTVLLSML